MRMKYINLVGQKFNRLLVLEKTHRNNKVYWKCLCNCGNITFVTSADLKRGTTKSCGCYNRDRIAKLQAVHNQAHTRLYSVWKDIRRRCYTTTDKSYSRYGGRGIRVCDEWRACFIPFRDWAFANGYDTNAEYGKCTLDRIDTNGDYCPENCRWVTLREQANNRRNNILLTYNNKTETMSNWAKIVGLPYNCLFHRIHDLHWTVDKALTTPLRITKLTPKI